MNIRKLKYSILAVAIFSFVAISIPLTVTAKQAQAQGGSDNSSQGSGSSNSENGSSDNSQGTQVSTGKLEGNKLEACQNRERVISNIMARVNDRGSKQLAVFDKISERVQAFYKAKGYTLTNYDELVTAVNAKRTEAQAAVQTMAQNGTVFDCGSDDPKGTVNQFKERAQAQIGALGEYKTAVKNLIVGVKTAATATETTSEVTE